MTSEHQFPLIKFTVTRHVRISNFCILFLSLQPEKPSLDHDNLTKTQLLKNGMLKFPQPEEFTPTSSMGGWEAFFSFPLEKGTERALLTCLRNNGNT